MKTVRIYRARKNSENQPVNTYLQYFNTMTEAKKSKRLDKWECEKVRYEVFNPATEKWDNVPR